jgi:hypothetical protein
VGYAARVTRGLALLLILGLFGACAPRGSLRADGTFRREEISYKIEAPDGWERMSVSGADLAWARKDLGASILVNSRCKGVDDAPLHVLTNHLLFGTTDREFVSQREVEVSRRAALESNVKARLDGVPRQLAILVMKKDGCVYDLVLDSSPERFAAALPAFEEVKGSFDVLTRSGS